MPQQNQGENESIFPKSETVEPRRIKTFENRLSDFYYAAIPFITINLAWFVLSLPVVTIFPATGGLYAAVMAHNKGETVTWGSVWEGFKRHWWESLLWGLAVLFGYALLAVSLWFYLNIGQTWGSFALTGTMVVGVIWFAITQFSLPLLLMQEKKNVWVAFRNGYVVAIRRPLSALKVMALSLVVVIVSVLIPPLWVFISVGLIAHIQTKTVLQAVKQIRENDAERDAIQAHSESASADEESNTGNAQEEQGSPQ